MVKSVLQSEGEKDDQNKDGTVSGTSKITGILGKHSGDQLGGQSSALTAKISMFCNEVGPLFSSH